MLLIHFVGLCSSVEVAGKSTYTALLHLPVVGDAESQPGLDARDRIYMAFGNENLPKKFDSSFNCKLYEMPQLQKAQHITRIEPIIDQSVHSLGIVHHIDLSFCSKSALKQVDASDPENCDGLEELMERGRPCYQMLWAYDRGAVAPYDTPADAGFRVGAGTPFEVLAMQIHYLAPENIDAAALAAQHYTDSSGVRLHLTESLRPHDLGTFAFMGTRMHVYPHTHNQPFSVTASKELLLNALGEDFALAKARGLDGLTLRQAHLHTHDAGKAVSLTRMRDGVSTVLIADHAYCGHGDCQHFKDLPGNLTTADMVVREGDSLVFTCAFSNDRNFTLLYGTANAQEMCGPIVLYTPHKRDMIKQISVAPQDRMRFSSSPLLQDSSEPSTAEVSATSLQPAGGAPPLPRFSRRGYIVDEQ